MTPIIDRLRSYLTNSHLVRMILLGTGTAVATFLAAMPALRVYRVPGAAAMIVAAAIASTAIAFGVARIWRQSPLVSYGISVLALIVLLLAGCGLQPAGIVREMVHGPNQVLTETLPLTGARAVITTLVVLTWLCGAATSEVLARVPRARGSLGTVAYVVPVGLFVLCYAAAVAVPGRDRVAGPLLLITLALMAVVRRYDVDIATQVVAGPAHEDASAVPSPLRAVAVGSFSAAAVTVVLAFAITSLPGMSSRPASVQRSAPTAPNVVIDPLDAMADLRDGNPNAAARTVMTVATDQASSGYLAMGILDQYDGAIWRFQTTFQPTGGRIPPASGEAGLQLAANTTVTQKVDITSSLPIPLLPALDRPTSVSGLSVVADPITGMLLPSSSGHSTVSYEVTSTGPDQTLAGLPSAAGIGASGGIEDTSLPADTTSALTTSLKFVASLTGARPGPTVLFLQETATALRSHEKRINPALPPVNAGSTTTTTTMPKKTPVKKKAKTAPTSTTTTTVPSAVSFGGTSLSEVINAITVDRAATPEQFATFYAMVARDLGVPARVVTGFRLTTGGSDQTLAAGSYQVTNRQAWAWVEVPVAGIGWVVVDPTPTAASGVVTVPPVQEQVSATTLPPPQANAVPRSQIGGGHALAQRSQPHIHPARSTQAWVLALLALAGLIVVLLLLGPGQAGARRAWRRQTRRSADPAESAVGAWLEALDGLTRAGMRPSRGLTNTEIAAEASIHFGPEVAEPLSEMASIADTAVYRTGQPMDGDSARHAWDLARLVGSLLRKGLDRRARIRSWLLVGSGPRRPAAQTSR